MKSSCSSAHQPAWWIAVGVSITYPAAPQILALSTMWAEDVYAFYGGKRADGHGGGMAQVWTARVFVVILTVAAYLIALAVHQHANIFELAIQYAFSGYASMAPIMLACLFWRRSTKWGALSSTLWVAGLLIAMSVVQSQTKAPNPGQPAVPIWSVNGIPILMREVTTITFTQYRLLMVVPMFVGSALAMILFSLLTPRPSPQAIARYFPARPSAPAEIPRPAVA